MKKVYFTGGVGIVDDPVWNVLRLLQEKINEIVDRVDGQREQKTEKEGEATITDTIRRILCQRYTVGHFPENKILVTLSPKASKKLQKECDFKRCDSDTLLISDFQTSAGSARIFEEQSQTEEMRCYIPYKENKK